MTNTNKQLSPQESLIDKWHKANLARIQAIETEKALRLQVAEEVFGYEPDELSTETLRHPLPNGFKAKMVFKVNESIDQGEVPNAMRDLREQGIPQEIINELFPVKYSVKKAILKALPQPAKDTVSMITSKRPGTPVLEIESPKGAK